jgi:hypothetical protein
MMPTTGVYAFIKTSRFPRPVWIAVHEIDKQQLNDVGFGAHQRHEKRHHKRLCA